MEKYAKEKIASVKNMKGINNFRNKICHFTTVHTPFDSRIFHKEIKTLIKAGYDVTLIAQNNKNEMVDGVKIIALQKAKNRIYRMFGFTLKTFLLAFKQDACIYHFHDPELIPVGLVLKLLGKKVIYDVHEDVPKQILDKNWIGNKNIRKIVSIFFNIFERFSVKFFVRIVVATSDIAKRFPKTKTIIIRNLPVLKLVDNASPINYKKNKPILIYAGSLTKIRGIKEIIHAMEFLNGKAELWLLGNWESEGFRKECENLKGWKHTKYLGIKKLDNVYNYEKNADIGLHVVYAIERHLIGLPTKIFEYMSCSIPVVMTESPYWIKLFGKNALFVNPTNPRKIAKAIEYLIEHPEISRKMGENGKKLILDKYNWEKESEKLVSLYEELLKDDQ